MAHTGMIVSPQFTNNNKWHASYGNHNKTVRSFSSKKDAIKYLKKNGVKTYFNG